MVNGKSVSLCMVVFNQSELAKKAIDSVKSIVDEIVILDQGSEESHSVYYKEIADFYSRTTNKGNPDYDRQFCYSLPSKEYILALDADEFLTEENLEKLKQLLTDYNPECVWFLFKNTISHKDKTIELNDILADDPHPRFWKKEVLIEGRPSATLMWPTEAHQYPQILTPNLIYADVYFNHERDLERVIRGHLHRGKNISPQALQTEKQFLHTILQKFGDEIKREVFALIPEFQDYLR